MYERNIQAQLHFHLGTEDFVFPLAPQGETGNVSPTRQYSPPPFKTKPQTTSIPSLLPAYPTRTPSPHPQENMKDKRISSLGSLETAKGGDREVFPSVPVKSLEDTQNDARLPTKDCIEVDTSSSTLDMTENDEQEDSGGEPILGWQSGDDSDVSGESPNSMVPGAGGYKGDSWRRGTTGSPGPSELMEMEHDLGLRPTIAIASTGGGRIFGFDTDSETAAVAATEHWKQERPKSGGGKERKRGESEVPHQGEQGKGRVVIRGGVTKKFDGV